ncbi:MAG: hypothetical protein IPK68_08845 [Bdellovibrionales bacterium]|jgi:hypothetical protein|nr:hypothetical protein [Bdellovibrionales bacterium]
MQKQKVTEVREVFSFYRGLILDLFEQELGDAKNWQFIRSRLLKILSPERGLEAKVLETILDGHKDEQVQ